MVINVLATLAKSVTGNFESEKENRNTDWRPHARIQTRTRDPEPPHHEKLQSYRVS